MKQILVWEDFRAHVLKSSLAVMILYSKCN